MASGWLRWILAAAMVAVVLFHVTGLAGIRLRRTSDRVEVGFTHVAMGVVMTAMLVGRLTPARSAPLAVAFLVPLLWFLCRGVHDYVMDGPVALDLPARHVVGCAAMVYMLAVAARSEPSTTTMPTANMSTMTMSVSSGSSPVLGAALVAATVGIAVWTLSRRRLVGFPATPVLATGCSLAMNATTVYMLLAL